MLLLPRANARCKELRKVLVPSVARSFRVGYVLFYTVIF
uniref:DEAD-box ATP-dependent RNA helicase 57 isoform X2 n=1 Tax=Rhizophora mucronata TaxID=61149 RepID=A0A2P2M364_RHIMU